MRKSLVVRGALACASASAVWVAGACLASESVSAASSSETALVALGRRLFQGTSVSRSGTRACASCHDAEHGWSDAKRVSDDADGPTRRHSQPVVDLGGSGFHWDGEFPAARDLVVARIGDPREAQTAEAKRMQERVSKSGSNQRGTVREGSYAGRGTNDGPVVNLPIPSRLAADERYTTAFAAAFGDGTVTSARVVEAVDAFVLSLRTSRNPVDRRLAGDASALTPEADRGLELFRGRAACATCHSLDVGADGRALLTDRKYHDTGVAFVTPAVPRTGGTSIGSGAGSNTGLRIRRSGPIALPDLGRGEQSIVEEENGSFKTPSLRDVALRAPYMHDGSLATLESVVRYYSKGGTPNAHLDPAMKPLDLTDGEVTDLVAFLGSLTGETRAGLLPPRAETLRMRVRVVDPLGEPVGGLTFQVTGTGERLGRDALFQTSPTTSSDGWAEFEFPSTTHVTLGADGRQLAYGRPIPDTARNVEVLAAPADRIVVRLSGENLPDRLTGTVSGGLGALLRGIGENGTPSDDEVQLPRIEGDVAGRFEKETFVFDRIRTLPTGEGVYTAPLGKMKGTRFVEFRMPDDRELAAAIDLTGGASAPAKLRRVIPFKIMLSGRSK